ncbi:MAG: tetratricopeptide repeat protein [Caulobacterales bacterium]
MSPTKLILPLGLILALSACATPPATAPVATGPAPTITPLDADASPYGLFLAGRAALDEGRTADASAYLGRAAAAEGGPSFLTQRAFTAALLSGDIAKAAALAPDGDDAEPPAKRLGVLVRGVDDMAQGKNKEAYALLSGPDAGYPHKAAAALLAPWAAAGAGDMIAATVRPTLGGDAIAQFVGNLDQAQLFERAGKYDQADASFKMLMTAGDAGGLVSGAYGAFLERRGRWNDAVTLYQDALARMPGDPQLIAGAARAKKHGRAPALAPLRQGAADALTIPAAGMMAQKQEDIALAYLRLALRLDPTRDEAWVLVGDLLAQSDDQDGARAAYAHARPGSEPYVTARSKLAWSYENADDHDTALKLAQATAAAAPESRDAAVTLADLLRANDRYEESAAVLDKLIDQPGATPEWRLYFMRASAYEEAGEWPKAEADLQAALKLSPDEPDLLNFLGYSWIDRGEHLKEALAMVQKAVDAEPQSGAMIDSLGWGYYRLGDYKMAVEKLEQAVTLEAADPDVNNHLGDAYWRVGRKTEAQFQWRRVLSLDPDDKLKAAVEAKLASPLGPDAPPAPSSVAAK